MGRSFLATGRTLIDARKGEPTMPIQDDQVTFNVFKAMRYPDVGGEYSTVDETESLVPTDDLLEQFLTSGTLSDEKN